MVRHLVLGELNKPVRPLLAGAARGAGATRNAAAALGVFTRLQITDLDVHPFEKNVECVIKLSRKSRERRKCLVC